MSDHQETVEQEKEGYYNYAIVDLEGDRVCGKISTESPDRENELWSDVLVVINPIRLKDQVVSFHHPQAGPQAVVIPLITPVIPGVNPLESQEDPIRMMIPRRAIRSVSWISDEAYNAFLASLRTTGPAEQSRVIQPSSLIAPLPRGS